MAIKKLTEYEESKVLAKTLDAMVLYKQIVCYSKTAQETFTTSIKTKMVHKAEGVRKGMPDYFIVTKSKLLVIELKRVQALGKKGQVLKNKYEATPEQLLWIETIQSYNSKDILATVCYGADEAIKFVKNNL